MRKTILNDKMKLQLFYAGFLLCFMCDRPVQGKSCQIARIHDTKREELAAPYEKS